MHLFQRTTQIEKNTGEVFNFFSKVENLNLITPPELQFKILTPLPVVMEWGTLIDYQLKLNGIPFRWKTKIIHWDPPFTFIDLQVKGPYRIWKHTHSFIDKGNFTEMSDRVEYLAPGWILEPLLNRFFIRKKVEGIFDYREKQVQKYFKNSFLK